LGVARFQENSIGTMFIGPIIVAVLVIGQARWLLKIAAAGSMTLLDFGVGHFLHMLEVACIGASARFGPPRRLDRAPTCEVACPLWQGTVR